VRKRLKLKKSELAEEELMGMWCVLDMDDSNQLMLDELGAFLKGNVVGFFLGWDPDRSKRPPQRTRRPATSDEPPKRRTLADMEIQAYRWPFAAPPREFKTLADVAKDEERKRREGEVWHAERKAYLTGRMRERDQRLARDAAGRAEAAQRERHRQWLARQRVGYRRQMLEAMRTEVLRSPVAVDGAGVGWADGRIGGGRLVPLYQSERLVACMEREPGPWEPVALGARGHGDPWLWPDPPQPPQRPSQAGGLVDAISRSEDVLASPSRHGFPSRAAAPRRTNLARASELFALSSRSAGQPRPRAEEKSQLLGLLSSSASRSGYASRAATPPAPTGYVMATSGWGDPPGLAAATSQRKPSTADGARGGRWGGGRGGAGMGSRSSLFSDTSAASRASRTLASGELHYCDPGEPPIRLSASLPALLPAYASIVTGRVV
jgi:hypothetical protein